MNDTPAARHDGAGWYVIRVRGHLGDRWADWFDGFTLTREPDGTSVLGGPLVDQVALHGALRKLSDLGLTLLSVTPVAASPRGTANTDASSPS